MNLSLKRRRFGQMMIASATTAAMANMADKTLAQSSSSKLVGFSLASNNLKVGLSVGGLLSVDVSLKTDLINTTPQIVIQTLDLLSGKLLSTLEVASKLVTNLRTSTESSPKALYSQTYERITDATTLTDGRLVISSVTSTQKGNYNKIVIFDAKTNSYQEGIKVSGFRSNNATIESVMAMKDNRLLSIISFGEGVPPFYFAVIDSTTGKISAGTELALPDLSPDERFSNLAQAPDGKIYATNIDREGNTNIVQIDLKNRSLLTGKAKIVPYVQLRLEKEALRNDLLSMAFSSSGQLYALAAPNGEKTKSLYTIDMKTGELQYLTEFLVEQIAFSFY
ncbi:MAG: hypothetical protein KAF91_30385 [Nostoc sp. TH1S01]|nr:hypothetical protein [Nostoc sp. TH1S01]